MAVLAAPSAACQDARTDDEVAQVDRSQVSARDTMKIQFERTGGFAGMTVNVEIDADSLPPSEKQQVETLVDRANFFSLPARIANPEPSRGADQFSYRVTIESNGRRHTVETSDGAAPQSLIPLLDWLNGAARRARTTGRS